jgi:hypothetical protein
MHSPDERLKTIRDNKNNALRAYTEKGDSATSAEKQALRRAWQEAELKFTAAHTDGLTKNSANLDDAVDELEVANKATRKALDELKTVAEVLGKVQQALVIAGRVLVAAV